jgi:hypothetical protein
METPKTPGWFTGRNRLVTIASLVAVGITGAIAVSANVGILNAAGNSTVGQVATASDLLPPNTQVVDVYLDSTTTAPAQTPVGQMFAVDTAGTVTVTGTPTSIRLDGVTPAAGWTWSMVQPGANQMTITFTNGSRTLEFTAVAGPDGVVTASVNEPIVTAAPPASHGGGSGHGSDDQYEGGGDDD